MTTRFLPREFEHQIPWSFRGSCLVKKKARLSIRRGFIFLMMLLPLFIPYS